MFPALVMCFSPYVPMGGISQGADSELANALFTLGSSKIKGSKTYLFDIVST